MFTMGFLGRPHGELNNLARFSILLPVRLRLFPWHVATLPPRITPRHGLPTLGRALFFLICLVPTPNLSYYFSNCTGGMAH
jgi:hypothetical protein